MSHDANMNPFGARARFATGQGESTIYRLDALEKQDFGNGVKAPNALLYLKLRRALLLQLHKSSVNWLLANNIACAR